MNLVRFRIHSLYPICDRTYTARSFLMSVTRSRTHGSMDGDDSPEKRRWRRRRSRGGGTLVRIPPGCCPAILQLFRTGNRRAFLSIAAARSPLREMGTEFRSTGRASAPSRLQVRSRGRGWFACQWIPAMKTEMMGNPAQPWYPMHPSGLVG